MHRFNHRKFARTYRKQGTLSLLLLIVTLLLAYTASPAQALFPPSIRNLASLDSEKYMDKQPIVRIHCDELSYTGYDNRSGDKVTGHYYYTLQDGRFLCFLLNSDTDNKTPQTLKNYTCTVRLINDKALYHQLIKQFAQSMDWSTDSLLNISIPVIASQPDCHLSSTILFVVALLVCIVIFSASAGLNFYHFHKCRKQALMRRHMRPSSDEHFSS